MQCAKPTVSYTHLVESHLLEDLNMPVLKEVTDAGQASVIGNSSIWPTNGVLNHELSPGALLNNHNSTSHNDISHGQRPKTSRGVELEIGVSLAAPVELQQQEMKEAETSSINKD
jgi:hypothetical protein